MKKRFIYVLPLLAVLIAGCQGENKPSSSTSDSTSILTTSTPTSSTPSSTSVTPTTTSQSSSSSSIPSTSSTSPIEKTVSIKKALELGEAHKKDVPSGSHEYFGEIITTQGRTIQNIAIGLNQSGLVYICDGEAMIPCLSGTGDNSLYHACSKYIDKDTSNYIVTGYIGYYYSMPCLNVISYELKQSMKFDIDYTKFNYDEYKSIENYNDFLETVDYNKKGYGESKLVKLTNYKCIAKADDNSWLMSDGIYVQGVYHQVSNTSLTIGSQYDLYGISCLYKWKPSLRILYLERSLGEEVTVDIPNLSISKTSNEMYSVGCPKEDIEKCTSTTNFIRTFKYFYKADLYFNYYSANANNYIVSGDKYYSSPISSQQSAKNNKMMLFNNDGFNRWRDGETTPVSEYLLVNQTLTSYFVEYQFTKNSGVMMPQVYMFEEYIPHVN